MTDPSTPTETDPLPAGPHCAHHARCKGQRGHHRHGKRRFLGLLVVALGLGVAVPLAFAGAHRGCERPATVEAAKEKALHWSDKVLDHLDATDTQRDSIEAVVERSVPGLFAAHEEGEVLRERFRAALLEPQVDAAALETIRLEALALADRTSKHALADLAEAAAALEPEQRAELAQWHDRLRGRWGHGARRDNK